MLAMGAHADETDKKAAKKATPGAEQKAARKELVDKYDANKNGRLDKEERSKMTAEDQEKWNTITAEAKKKAAAKKAEEAAK